MGPRSSSNIDPPGHARSPAPRAAPSRQRRRAPLPTVGRSSDAAREGSRSSERAADTDASRWRGPPEPQPAQRLLSTAGALHRPPPWTCLNCWPPSAARRQGSAPMAALPACAARGCPLWVPPPPLPPLCWRSQAARARVVVCVVSHLDEDLHEGRLLYASPPPAAQHHTLTRRRLPRFGAARKFSMSLYQPNYTQWAIKRERG